MKNNLELFALKDLTHEYCRIRGLKIDQNVSRRTERCIDLFIRNGDEEGIGVLIKDWKRAVGFDMVIDAEKITKSSRSISKILIVSNFFSDPARSLAEKIGIFLLSKNDLLRIISSDLAKKTAKSVSDHRENVVIY